MSRSVRLIASTTPDSTSLRVVPLNVEPDRSTWNICDCTPAAPPPCGNDGLEFASGCDCEMLTIDGVPVTFVELGTFTLGRFEPLLAVAVLPPETIETAEETFFD